MNKRKLFTALTAALCAVSLTACSVKFGTNVKPDANAEAARPTGGSYTDDMIITYGDFDKEYQYYLYNKGITDDTEESVAETCKSQRYSIITGLIMERIMLHEAELYGVSELTEEENTKVTEAYDKMITACIELYGRNAENWDSLSDEDKQQVGNEELDKVLKKCGLTRDDLLQWQKISVINTKLEEATTKDSDYSKAEASFDAYVEQVKQVYSTDIETYQNYYYSTFWIPDGARYVKHILLGFDEDTQNKITELRSAGDEEGADSLRAEKAEELSDKVKEVEDKLDSGEDWAALITEYSADATGSSAYPDGYLVLPDGTNFMEEFQEAAMSMEKAGDRTTCVTDYGVHIMTYASEAVITEEQKKNLVDYLYSQQKQSEYSELLRKWESEFNYQIDYEMLKIDDESAESSDSTASTESAGSTSDNSGESSAD